MVSLSRSWHAREKDRAPVLLLHGLGSRGEDWALQTAALAPAFPLLAVDLRGHGSSPSGPGWPTMADLTRDVIEVLGDEAVDRVHVVDLSLGAAVALQLALDQAGSVVSLTLVNGFAALELGWRRRARAMARLVFLLLGCMDWSGSWVARSVFPRPEQAELRRTAAERLAENDRGDDLRALWALRGFDLRERLAEVRIPTLVVAGSADRIVPLGAKRELAERIPGAEVVPVAGSGHATPLDAAPRFHRILLSFLERAEGSALPSDF